MYGSFSSTAPASIWIEFKNSARFSFGSTLQVFDVLLDLVGHDVERLRQFANLGARVQFHAAAEIALRNRAAGLRQDFRAAS